IRIYEWAHTDSKDDQEYPRRRSSTDPDGLEDEAIWAEVWLASGKAPEAPVFEGLKLRSTQDLHVESNPAYKVRVWTFRRTTTGEDIINRNTSLTTDVSGLETTGKKAAWNATPEPHAGLVARNETVLVFNDDKTLHVIEEGLETVQAQRERQASSETVDANELDGQLVAAAISATEPAKPSAPAGLVFRHWKKQKQEDGRYLWTAVYGPADSKQEIEFGSTVSIDVDTLDASAAVVVVQNADAPSWPETPPFTGAVAERYRRDRQLSQTRWQYTYIYSYETPAQKLVREATQKTIDPTGINSTATTAGFDAAAPAHPTLVKVAERSRQLPNGHTLNEADWGTANTAQAIVRELARSVTDPAGIDDQAIVATLGTASAGSNGGLTLARTEISYARDGSTITQKVYDRVGDGAARRTLSSWRVHLDARTYETTSEPEVITCDLADLRTTAAAIFAENQANVEFEGVTLEPLPGGKALKTLHWAKDDKLLDVSIRSEWQSMRSVYIDGEHMIA
ncbi:MAG TPA: hypothetical protein PLD57_18395, partial [Aggregatilineales bacterium]|nr:hypothetical protein [Aggregatilineales bacterium]